MEFYVLTYFRTVLDFRTVIHAVGLLPVISEKYAKENGNTATGVVIEALDTVLWGQKAD